MKNKDLTSCQIKKKINGKCISRSCPNDRRTNYCNKCIKRKYAKDHPVRNAFYNLRQNAKRRGKEFILTLEQFRRFAISTDYMNKRGKRKTSYSIDRVDNSKGYSVDNITVLTLSQNSVKRNQIDYTKSGGDLPF